MAALQKSHKELYWHLPESLRNVAASLAGYRGKRHKYGHFFCAWTQFLRQSAAWPLEQKREWQWRQTQDFIRYAVEHVPYYRALFKREGLRAEDLRHPEDLKNIPILSKDTLKQNSTSFLSDELRRFHPHQCHTSGSSGKPLTLQASQWCYQREYAFTWSHRGWHGIDRNMRKATFAGHPVVDIAQSRPPFWVRNWSENQAIFSSYHLSEENLRHYVSELERFQPVFIHGYPSSLHTLAEFMLRHGVDQIRPRCIVTASETLLDFQRQAIEAAFGCKVRVWYGNTEMCANIVECPQGNLHVRLEHSLVEFLSDDENEASPDEMGRVICTGFGNRAMPLIRYDIGDLAVPKRGSCSCGISDHLMERIIGRMEDVVITPDGRHVGRLDHIFKDDVDVREAQIVQTDPSKIIIKIVRGPNYSVRDENKILAEAKDRLGRKMFIDVAYVASIPRGANGKLKFVISHVAQSMHENSMTH